MTITLGSEIAPAVLARLNINAKTICFASATPMSTREIVTNSDNNICGDLDPFISRAQKGRKMVKWQFAFDLTYPIAEHIFPLLGVTIAPGANGPWTLGPTDPLVSFAVVIDMVGEIHSIAEAFITKFAFRGSKGSRPVQMTIDVVGVDEVAGTFTVDKLDFGDEFAFTHSSLTMENDAGTPAYVNRPFDRFMLQVDSNPIIEHNNSITMTDIQIGNRQSVFATSIPYVTAHNDTFFNARDFDEGIGSVLILDNGTKELTFTMPAGIGVARPGNITGKADQIRTPVTMLLHRDIEEDDITRIPPITISQQDSP